MSRSGQTLSHLFFADDVILFAKAEVSQAILIKQCLQCFCAASGQKVSLSKSNLFISANVSSSFASSLSRFVEIPLASNLGKYLRAPSLQCRVSKENYGEVLERMQQKLQGWKLKCLSMAARTMLIKAVTSTIPTYIMQSSSIQKSIYDKMDCCHRQFLWGSSNEQRRIHKVKWTKVC